MDNLIDEQKRKLEEIKKERELKLVEVRKRQAEKDKMMKLLELSFSDYFSDDYKDDDLNE